MTAEEIVNALIAVSDDRIWATELQFLSGKRRADFWTLEPIRSKGFRATAYEIKISRADFGRDHDEKHAPALEWSDRFWYVTPPGLISVSELPSYAGLQEWDGENFAIKRRAPKRQKTEPTWELLVAILRNCGDVRRDVGLLKAQLAYLQHQVARAERDAKWRRKRFMDRWLRQAKDSEAA